MRNSEELTEPLFLLGGSSGFYQTKGYSKWGNFFGPGLLGILEFWGHCRGIA